MCTELGSPNDSTSVVVFSHLGRPLPPRAAAKACCAYAAILRLLLIGLFGLAFVSLENGTFRT